MQMTDFEDLEFIKWIEKLNNTEIKEFVNKFEKYIGDESKELKDGFVESKKLVEVIINKIRNVEKITKLKNQ